MLARGIARYIVGDLNSIRISGDLLKAMDNSGKSDKEIRKSIRIIERNAYLSEMCKRLAIVVGIAELIIIGIIIFGDMHMAAADIWASVFWIIVVLVVPLAGMVASRIRLTKEAEKYIGTPEERLKEFQAHLNRISALAEYAKSNSIEGHKNDAQDVTAKTNDNEQIVKIKAKDNKRGNSTIVYRCDSCDTEIKPGMKYCPGCGDELDWSE